MELRTLRYFIAVVETGSLSAASQVVRVSQPSLSRQLAALEKELGLGLFDRTPRGLIPTSAGRHFLAIATDLVQRADLGLRVMKSEAKKELLPLTVACPAATVTHVIAPFIAATGAPIADALIRDPADAYAAVRRGESDMAVSTLLPEPDTDSLLLYERPVFIQVLPQHPLAAEARVDVAATRGHRLILMGRRSAVRAATEAAFRRAGVQLDGFDEPESSSMAQALAATGRGACIVLDNPTFGLVSRPLTCNGEAVTSPLYGAWDPGHYARQEIHATMLNMRDWMQAGDPVSAAGPGNTAEI
ncbi:LysR family transcriptional regulator [Arthrobacter sp. I2-34]|uniref:LysR family transcriptional regulator n=1 Tax=Arthrobacter hankyongi TaxID=2904801 RepID=A0ABS9LCT6_9MICC|nr:LysR family transcriptional regulator [Arthrobacter hankyongi]MCG2624476.1 LysR family transcriptional regulator [Arthrobacter hankyongi]